MYCFTRTDGTVMEAKCSVKTDLCMLSGDGLASSNHCFRNEKCRSDVCKVSPDSMHGFGNCGCKLNTQIGCDQLDNENKICASP
jgi:hypothetical protein